MGCSILKATKRVLEHATSTITVTETLTPAVNVPASQESCTPVTITIPQALDDSLAGSYLTATKVVQEGLSSLPYNKAGLSEQRTPESSSMTFTTRTTYSSMSLANVVKTPSSTLSFTGVLPDVSTVSSLAASSPKTTNGCDSASISQALDYHVFRPLVDLSLNNSQSLGATTVTNPHDSDSENCAPYTVIYLPNRDASTCMRMTGEWTPRYSNVYYECIARVRAPDFDRENYMQSTTGLNFTLSDGAYSVLTSRTIGRRPERRYKQSSMMLFAPEKKSYNVEFWACGAGPTLLISELSCTHYG